ncbi:protein POLR1D-like isoform X2 [Leptopilina heterotoma]|uniref:protein POLR1D-like isoform X2 n=1 Tax=Leptopilina heterotoma TaxID=63436 RepID=UPI001CA89483|nr:protein POLR1D-like isoform X2 [Leptopilina heterotoma]
MKKRGELSAYLRLAVEALLDEAKVGARRAEILGPTGWVKPKESVNKRFLHSTLRNAVQSNKKRVNRENTVNPSTSTEAKKNLETIKKRDNT